MKTSFPAPLVPTSLRTAVGNAGGAGTETPQHLVALEGAQRIRLAGANALREVRALGQRAGMARAAEIIASDDHPQLKTQNVLSAVRGFGPKKVKRLLLRAEIRYGASRISALTPRQRECLCDDLREGPLSSRVAA